MLKVGNLEQIEADLSSYDANGQAVATLRLPENEYGAVIGASVDSLTRLEDHQVMAAEHNDYNAVTKDTINSADFGVPLQHFASFHGHVFDGADGARLQHIPPLPFTPWPGRIGMVTPLLLRAMLGQELSEAQASRLLLSALLPCAKPTALWPLMPKKDLKVTIKRHTGAATSVRKLWFWVLRLPREIHSRFCSGAANWIDYPQWLVKRIDLAAIAATASAPKQRVWSNYDNYAIRVQQIFAATFINSAGDETGDLTLEADYGQNVSVRLAGYGDEKLVPDVYTQMRRVSEFAPFYLQQFDCYRDPGLIIRAKRGLNIWTSHDTTGGNAKSLYLTFMGGLRQQDNAAGAVSDSE